MTMLNNNNMNRSAYKFSLDILIESSSNAAALEKILRLLQNDPDVLDLRVQSGSQLGSMLQLLESMQKQAHTTTPFGSVLVSRQSAQANVNGNKQQPPVQPGAAAPSIQSPQGHAATNKSNTSAPSSTGPTLVIEKQIEQYIQHQTLTRLSINKGKGIKMSLPCRILNYDSTSQLLNVYHVDEKQVYAFHLYEIEEMTT
ncbi:hypothetical protein [Paenibacillus sp. UMB4589-SE434]|uniref:hypothetical protein n=1 Tax=Paenibacillus sp. UMB4589-SE434 TaxID=3046314 RepID=UPI00254C658B|nr:hypothetical protein [Paenibacillus sp. UMB4589-SE434]MDK8182265.1 hypothetical protein [Paenibacillus sp. UMB4589-SE434]